MAGVTLRSAWLGASAHAFILRKANVLMPGRIVVNPVKITIKAAVCVLWARRGKFVLLVRVQNGDDILACQILLHENCKGQKQPA